MPQPTASDVHLDAILTNISIAYLQDAKMFVATQVFPIVPVDKKSDKYYIFTKNDFYRDQVQKRGPGAESAGSGYGLSTGSYYCDVWALHKDIDDQIRANSDAPLNPDRNASEFLTQQMLIRMEKQWASDFFTTGVWGTDATPTNLWSDQLLGDPVTDIETAKTTILSNTGYLPNTAVMGYQVWAKLKQHPDIVDRFKYTSSQSITTDMVARMFELEKIHIAQTIAATNNEGETATFSFNLGKNCLVCYVAPNPALEVATAGYTFAWTAPSGPMGTTLAISSFRIPQIKSDRVEIESAWGNKVIASDMGYFFSGAVS